MLEYRRLLSILEVNVFDDASDAAAADAAAAKTAADAAAAKEAAAKEAAAKEAADKTSFTQDEVNKMLAKQKTEMMQTNKQAIGELEALQGRADLTKQENDDLAEKLTQMKKAHLTKEELALQDKQASDSEHATVVTDLKTQLESITNRYTKETISRSITDAAAEHDALVAEQIIAILQPKTQLEEEADAEGNKTGKLVPMVAFEITDDEGANKTLSLTVTKAVEKMREIPKYQNLFKIEGQGGLGQFNTSGKVGGGQLDVKKLSQDPEAYRKARAENKV